MKKLRLGKNNLKIIVEETVNTLKKGGLVVYPSDTVYGLLVDATNKKAVDKLIAFKNRPPGKAISVFINGKKSIETWVVLDFRQREIIDTLLPGPFTVIADSRHKVLKELESEKGTLGVRVPLYEPINMLCSIYPVPITATSANLGGRSPHYSLETLLRQLPSSKLKLLDLFIDAGKLPRNKPSTIVDLTMPGVRILRHGDVVFKKSKCFRTVSPEETKKVGRFLIDRYHKKGLSEKPISFIIEGELGVGKTVLVKGMGDALGIDDIVSPTFVIYYEYGNFYHFDLYQITEKEEFKHLGLDKILKKGNILCFEWGEKTGEIESLLNQKSEIVNIKMSYVSDKEREIFIGNK